MRTLGNILWHFPLLGFIRALAYLVSGCLCCLTVLLIPVGLGWFQLAKYYLLPFDRAIVTREELAMISGQPYKSDEFMSILNVIARILYFIPGCVAVVAAAVAMVGQFISLIGIPAGLVESRILRVYFNPVKKICVPREVEDHIKALKAQTVAAKYATPPAYRAPAQDASPACSPETGYRSDAQPGAPATDASMTDTRTTDAPATPENLLARTAGTLRGYTPGISLVAGVAVIYLFNLIYSLSPLLRLMDNAHLLPHTIGAGLMTVGLVSLASRSHGTNRIISAVLGIAVAVPALLMVIRSAGMHLGFDHTLYIILGIVGTVCSLAIAGMMIVGLAGTKNRLMQYGCALLLATAALEILCGFISPTLNYSPIRHILLLVAALAGWAFFTAAMYEESRRDNNTLR